MFRKNHILFALVMSFSASAFALVGGPFDNGDFSELMDQNGIYQWTATFKNGIGEGQFNDTTTVGPTATTSAASAGAATTNNSIGSVQDRSIFYYKGVTFFGGCFGLVDLSSKTISCVTNGASEVTISTSGSSGSGTTGTGSTATVTATSDVVNNGNLGFVANSEWSGNITSTNPTLRFHATGELTIISPNAQNIISGLAQTIVGGATSSTTGGGTTIVIGAGVQTAASLAVLSTAAFQNAITPQNVDQVQQTSDQQAIDVTGTRKFFIGQ